MTPVTDPLILQSLNNQAGSATPLQPVDPATAAQLDAAAPTPTGPSIGASFLHGIAQPFVGAAQLLSHNPLDLMFGKPAAVAAVPTLDKTMDQFANNFEQNYQKARAAGGQTGIDWPEIAGNTLSPLNFAANMIAPGSGLVSRIGSGLLSGAATAAMQPVTGPGGDFLTQKAGQAAEGGLLGAAMAPVAGALSRVVSPNTAAAVQLLRASGVNPTPGQILGGTANSLEQGLTSLPVAGDFIKNARRAAVEQFNEGAINNALAPIDEKLTGSAVGNDAIGQMQGKISDFYTSLTPKLGWPTHSPATMALQTGLAQLQQGVAQTLPADSAQQFNDAIDRLVGQRLSPGGGITGESFQEAKSDLGKMAIGIAKNPNSDFWARKLSSALFQAQGVLRDAQNVADPTVGSALSAADDAFARSLRVNNAGGRLAGEPGIFTPRQFMGAVNSLDPSLRKNAFAAGDALMQDYAKAGVNVLGNTLPDSGTPYRHLMQLGTGLAAASLGGHALEGMPVLGAASQYAAPAMLGYGGLSAATGAAYSPWGRRILGAILASRPNAAVPVASAVRGLLPAISGAQAPAIAGGLLATP